MFSKFSITLIEWYWANISPEDRKVCLFKDSCSVAVHRELNRAGFLAGLRLFWFRYWNCKPGYRVVIENNFAYIFTAKGRRIGEQDINPVLLREIKISNP